MNQLKVVLGSLALLAAGVAPNVDAHYDSTPWALDDPFTLPTFTSNSDRVSGVYYGSAQLLVDLGVVNAAAPLPPTLCDLEVLGPGDSLFELDEPEVDGRTNSASFLRTTLFNDGGVGEVCHTHDGYYANPAYNTAGCNYGPAYGVDIVLLRVWITTVCDYGHATSGIGLATYVLACTGNVRTNDVEELVSCGANVANCLTPSPLACLLSAGMECGTDESGSGGVRTPGQSGWNDVGVAFDSVPSPCSDEDGAASVLVQTAVLANTVSVPRVGIIY